MRLSHHLRSKRVTIRIERVRCRRERDKRILPSARGFLRGLRRDKIDPARAYSALRLIGLSEGRARRLALRVRPARPRMPEVRW